MNKIIYVIVILIAFVSYFVGMRVEQLGEVDFCAPLEKQTATGMQIVQTCYTPQEIVENIDRMNKVDKGFFNALVQAGILKQPVQTLQE